LIELYTYKEDLVVDPFMGSGSTAVAAIRTGRHYVGYDTDPSYVAVAEARAENERRAREQPTGRQRRIVLATRPDPATGDMDPMARAVSEGQRAKEIARIVIQECGFIDIVEDRRFGSGVEVNFVAHDREGRSWFFDVSGAFTSPRAGLRRTDTLWKALGKAAVLKASGAGPHRLVLLTTDLPPRGGTGDAALRSTRGEVFHDAVEMLSAAGQERLEAYAAGDGWESPLGDLLPPDEPDDL
jgi:site-specific DNA-methyltransferase (adenine-specific)